MTVIGLAHSPDSDDAFMFYGLASGRVATGERQYRHELADIETLNQRALNGELDVTAVSIHAYAHLADRYVLLRHGASIGDRYGPRVVATQPAPGDPAATLRGAQVAIPGTLTTAALALRLFQPEVQPVVMPFDRIEGAVAGGEVPFGVLIHEGQLTYGDRGLHLWVDLGEWWHDETGLPLPLGGNVVRRALGATLVKEISHDLRASILYGLEHREEALAYAMQFARGLDRATADRFIGMYVNTYTVDYGPAGRQAVATLLRRGFEARILPHTEAEFADD
jgi:1,4-dihydroxy-6-naphthoate synthase